MRSGQIKEEALACYKRALQVFNLESFPRQHRDTQLNWRGSRAIRQNWQEAHTAYQGAMKAEDLLVALGTGVKGHDVNLARRWQSSSPGCVCADTAWLSCVGGSQS